MGKVRVAVITLTVTALVMVVAPPARAGTVSVRGEVMCVSQNSVVGVWIESTKGGSKWASWKAVSGAPYEANYSASISYSGDLTQVRLHVGCGGSPQKWGSTNRSKYYYASGGILLNVTCYDVWSAYYAKNFCQRT